MSASNVTAENITSDWGVQVTATNGTITVVDVVSNNDDSSNGGNILMHATGDIGTGNLKNNGTSTIGGIEIHANESGTSSVFNIGGGGSNGTGTLDVRTVTGGGTANDSIRGGIWVSNGSTGSTGGISVSSMSDILLTASASRSGILFLDAKAGDLTLPAGALSSDGGASSGAGLIVLLANTINTANGTVITASQNSGAAGTYHAVFIAASVVNTSGSSGLVIQADGNGVTGIPGSAAAGLVPEGSISLASTDVLNALYWNYTVADFLTRRDSVIIAGSGSFKATANGNYSQLSVSGAPVNFTSDGDVTLEAKGAIEHNIKVGFFGTLTGSEGLVFTGSGDFKADASGVDGNGGKVEINGAVSEISSPSFVVKADGPAAGNGEGGTIKWFSSELSIDEASTVSFTADAALAGTGNAKSNAIDFRSDGGVIAIGTEAGQASFSAKGGSVSGNGGTIKFVSDGAVTVYGAGPTASVFDVSVPGETGNGGKIDILAVQGITFDGDASYLKADSGSVSGDGGTIKIDTSVEQVIIGTDETGAVDLSAKSNGDGKGGTVDIYSPVGIRANGAHINVSAGGSEQGGTISLNAGSVFDLYISGTLRADGGDDDGEGGSITLIGGKVTLPGDENTEVMANGKGAGNGGQIDITTNFEGGIRIGNGTAEIRLEARSEDSGNGGTINLLADGEMYLYGAAIDVNVLAGDGNGGTIKAESRTDTVTVVGDLVSSGFGSGNGGSIELKAYLDMDLTDAWVRAPGGETGNGGEITLTVEQVLTIDATSEISAQAGEFGNGEGGTVTVNANAMTIEGTLKADGFGTGTGGTIGVNSESDLDLSGSTISASGGESGNGGTVSLEYDSSDELIVNSITAYGSDVGGRIEVSNLSQNVELKINGLVSTDSLSEDFGGGFIIEVGDNESQSVQITLDEASEFSSVFSASATSFSLSSLAPNAHIGLNEITATTGNISVCGYSSSSCLVAARGLKGAKLLDDSSIIGITEGPVQALNGDVRIAGKTLSTKPSPGADRNIIIPGSSKKVLIETESFTFGENTYILGSSGSGAEVRIESPDSTLDILIPTNKVAGIKSATGIAIYSANHLQIGASECFCSLIMESSALTTIQSGANITAHAAIGAIDIGGTSPQANKSPNQLFVSGNNVEMRRGVASVTDIDVTSTGYLEVSDLRAGIETGSINLHAQAYGRIGGNNIARGDITFGGDSTLLISNSAVLQALSNGNNSASLGLSAGGNIAIDGSALLESYGDIAIWSGTLVLTNTSPVTYPANVVSGQITETNGGQIYWGDSFTIARIDAGTTQTQTFSADVHSIAFYMDFANLLIGPSVTFRTH